MWQDRNHVISKGQNMSGGQVAPNRLDRVTEQHREGR